MTFNTQCLELPAWARGANVVQIPRTPLWLRGVCPVERFRLDRASVGDCILYGLDFSSSLPPGDRVVKSALDISGGTIVWSTLIGSICAICVVWAEAGISTIRCAVIRSFGAVRTVTVEVPVTGKSMMVLPSVQPYPPNAYVVNGIIVPDADGNPLILG